MEKDHWIGVIVIVGILAVGFLGGGKKTEQPMGNREAPSGASQMMAGGQNVAFASFASSGQKTESPEISPENQSPYRGIVHLRSVSRNSDPSQEYVTISMDNGAESVLVTGWKLTSTRSGNSVVIPKGIYLYFTNSTNVEDNIFLNGGDTLYLVTGNSPIYANFKVNKCIGYVTGSRTFTPPLYSYCPLARNENLSKIPTTTTNDACFDYIDSYPSCKTQTEPLPQTWSAECRDFIQNKLTYPSCVDTHKSDKDFYTPEWRVYLKRDQILWKDKRETIVLYDNNGKFVDTLSY